MRYALIDSAGKLAAIDHVESPEDWVHEEGFTLIPCPEGFEPEHDYGDYTWDGVSFAYEAPVLPLEPADVLRAIFAASPALTVGIVDSVALRMRPYIPEYDPSATYTVGSLAVRSDKIMRKTLTGWRELE